MKKHLFSLLLLLSFAGMTMAQSPDPIVEDFETGDFSLFEWQNDSVYPWVIDTLNPYDGLYCMKSSNAGQANTTSAIQVSIDIPEDCIMSFYSQISGMDYGRFYIDGELKNSYINQNLNPSSWGRKVFDVTAGEHIFRWEYTKDETGDSFDDCFYVDSITFYRHLELPLHGWHTYCGSDFNNAVGDLGTPPFTAATCYTPDIASKYTGTMITKVAIFSDTLYNAVGGNYSCSLFLGGETPDEGVLVSTISVDVPQGLNEWVEYDLDTPVSVTGNLTIWVVWDCYEPVSSWPMGVCNDIDPSGNGNWSCDSHQWSHQTYGDWTVKTYFQWDGPQPQPQDVYFAGHGNGIGKVWKDNELIQSISDTTLVDLSSLQVTADGSIYTAGYSHDTTYSFVEGRIWLNDNVVFDAGQNTAINKLELYGNQWTAAGVGENEWENVTGLVWQDGEILYAYSDSIHSNQIWALALDTLTGDVYTGGNTAESESRAVVWKNDTILWVADTTSTINAIAFDGSDLYSAGIMYLDDQIYATLWQNDSIVFQINSFDIESGFDAIALYDSSIYLAGYMDDSMYVWRDGEVLFAHPLTGFSEIKALVVNEAGVYYAGRTDNAGTVWKDGEVLYQPEDCDIVNALCLRPTPPQSYYTITVESSNLEWGTVSGGGTYPEGDTAYIFASPNIGCEFLCWNDGNAESPRSIVVTQDSTFVALFARTSYTIEVVSDHPEWGSVSGGGTFYYGDTIQIEAIPNPHYSFTRWNDGNTDNPRTVIVTGDHTYTARFEAMHYHIATMVLPEGAGHVQGGGTYYYGDTVSLFAYGYTGYNFDRWEDGEIENPRDIIVESDSTFTAVFSAEQYEVTVDCDPIEGGTVTGTGTYNYGSYATLKAIPNENYMFICWSDGIVTNPRIVLVTHDIHLQALFHLNGTPTYTITVLANEPELGTVTGSGTYPEGSTIEISATPYENVLFLGWDDGNTDNPRSVTVTQDMTFTALFKAIPPVVTYTITVRSENPFLGSVYGGGTYPADTVINIGAIPSMGFYFSGWQDGNVDNPRSIVVTGDAEYIASFSPNPVETYTVTVIYDETQGFILGAGTYLAGATATIAAIPADGFYFKKWSDNTTDNPKEVYVDHDIVLTAFFDPTGVDENGNTLIHLYPNPANDMIRIEGLDAACEVSIYNNMGIKVKTVNLQGDYEISVNELPAGLYLIRIDGRHTMKFVKR